MRLQPLKLMQRAFNTAVAVLGAGVSVFYPRSVRLRHARLRSNMCTVCTKSVAGAHLLPDSRTLLPYSYLVASKCRATSSIMWVYRIVFAADEPSEHAMKDEPKQTVTSPKAFPGPLHTCRYLYCM